MASVTLKPNESQESLLRRFRKRVTNSGILSTVRRKLWLSRSVVPFKMDFSSDPEKTVVAAFERLRQRNRLMPGDQVVVVSDVAAGDQTFTAVQVRQFQ